MIVYIDDDFKCHVSDDGTMKAIETDLFDGKCNEFIEGFRLVPEGNSWTRSDGETFEDMSAPWKNYDELVAAQAQYERMMAETEEAYREGVNSLD